MRAPRRPSPRQSVPRMPAPRPSRPAPRPSRPVSSPISSSPRRPQKIGGAAGVNPALKRGWGRRRPPSGGRQRAI